MRLCFIVGVSVITALAATPMMSGSTLKAGDILEVRFSTTAPVCPFGACDVLELFPNEAGAFFDTNFTANLLLGTTLLGTYFDPITIPVVFRSPSSLFAPPTPSATVDFTAINSGVTNGIIDLSMGTGFWTWPGEPTPILYIGHTLAHDAIHAGTGIQITSITILSSPEPSTFVTLLGGLIFLLVRGGFSPMGRKALQ